MRYKPHGYQQTAYNWIMTHERCGLFLDMGLGKTVITLTAIKDLIDSLDAERVLVIAPLRVAEDTWTRESAKWDHLKDLRISRVLGPAEKRREALKADADIYVINRENVKWLTENTGKWTFDTVVIDELSSFKSPASQRFKALRKVIPASTRVIGLTGTPAPNGYLDLWSEVYLLDRGERLGLSMTRYRMNYFDNVSHSQQFGIFRLKKGAQAAIDDKLKNLCMSMTATDYLTMPERIDNEISVKLTDKERSAYREMERQALLSLDDGTEVEAFSATSVMGKLLQMANGFVYDAEKIPHTLHQEKLDALDDILDAAQGQPVLVFYWFKADLEALLGRFPNAVVFRGSAEIEAWNTGKVSLMLVQPQAAGHGLNLQEGGHIIVWYGLTWSLELYQQANARLYRQGQTSDHVVINHLIAEGTVDEQVMKALKSKDVTQSALMAALKERKEHV